MKFSILHGYSDSNKGDLAIVLSTVYALRKKYPEAEVVLHSVYARDDPSFEFHHRHVSEAGVRVVPLSVPSPYVDDAGHGVLRNLSALVRFAKNVLKHKTDQYLPSVTGYLGLRPESNVEMESSDLIILKGGQYIYNDQGGLRGLLYLWRILLPIHFAASRGKATIILGQSLGPISGRMAERIAKSALERCRAIVVREQLSDQLLRRLNLGAKSIVAPDFAFLTEPSLTDDGEAHTLDSGRWLGLTVVNWSFPGVPNRLKARRRYEDELFDACVSASQLYGLKIALFPQVTVRHHGESDVEILTRIGARLNAAGVRAVRFNGDYTPPQLAALYSRCALLLGTRLHSCILAACVSTPVIAIRYQGYKTEGVMRQLGLENFVHDIGSVSADGLLRSIGRVIGSETEIREQIAGKVDEMRRELAGILSRIA